MADDPYLKFQAVMRHIHRAIKKGLEQSVMHLEEDAALVASGTPSALRNDLSTWLAYVGTWNGFLTSHHDTEEQCIFPLFEAKGVLMDEERQAHAALHAQLDEIDDHVKQWSAKPDEYDGSKLLHFLHTAKQPLFDHLDAEVARLDRSKLEPRLTQADMVHIDQESERFAKAHFPSYGMPFLFHHLSPQEKVFFADQPFVFMRLILPVMHFMHLRIWKYAPYKLRD